MRNTKMTSPKTAEIQDSTLTERMNPHYKDLPIEDILDRVSRSHASRGGHTEKFDTKELINGPVDIMPDDIGPSREDLASTPNMESKSISAQEFEILKEIDDFEYAFSHDLLQRHMVDGLNKTLYKLMDESLR